MPLWIPGPIMSSTARSFALTASPIETVDGTTTTFSAQDFGPAGSSRIMVAAFGEGPVTSAPAITSVTIGGVAATLINGVLSTSERVAIYAAAVPTGTSGDVVIVWTQSCDAVGLNLYSMIGYSITPTDSGTSTTAGGGTFDLDIAAGGVAIGFQVSRNNTDVTHTWAGLIEDTDDVLTAGAYQASGASGSFATTQTNLTCSCTPSASNIRTAFVVASFPPA